MTDESDAVHVGDAHEEDGQVTRDAKTPESRLSRAIAGENAGRGAMQGVGINHRAGEAGVELRVRLSRLELMELELTV